jgi:hypothetical protein
MTQETLTLLAGGAGTAAAAFVVAMIRKLNATIGAPKKGEDSLRDLVLRVDGKLDGTNQRIERIEHRLTLVETEVFPEESERQAALAKQ